MSIPVVRVGAGGVTGSAGLVQSPVVGAEPLKSPKPLFRLRSRGNASEQHLLEKSSRSMVQAMAPP